jgi:hydrogenase maturation protein HypF
MRIGVRIEMRGIVQGVGFRPWICRVAHAEGIAGRVRNDAAGVTVEAFGAAPALERFLRQLSAPPAAAEISELRTVDIPDADLQTFEIEATRDGDDFRISIPADLATCPDCLAEVFDPGNRRFRYPFTNCTNCGPRFTICREAPYDRPATTMASFTMCPDCQREYDTESDRRFHAQPNACPVCGPRLLLATPQGDDLASADPLAELAALLRSGAIVAIKGIGGFHLACDATSSAAVNALRRRKHRDEKPFAVMVRDLDEAARLAVVGHAERTLLASIERPIVLVARREPCDLADEIAPRNPMVGLMLPYTALHHLLMRELGRPMVLTSGNVSEEPIAYTNAEALERLASIADLFLLHDRDIVTRCDDSVARIISNRPVVFRRSRGYVPKPVAVTPPFDVPVLACGALLKNAFCIGAGDSAFLGPHIGDLENLETYTSFQESIARMMRFLRVRPEIVAYDLHPDYMSTRYALEQLEVRHIGVQHHHAHIASATAEHGLSGPVIGVAYDGTGYGTDGTAWGGEVMLADDQSFERVATFRAVPLPGGDAAIRHPWRIALALLDDTFDGNAPLDAFLLFSGRQMREVAAVRQLIAHRVQSPLAHGVGRYFDGIGALALARADARFEGQVALEWNGIADPDESGLYGFEIDRRHTPWVIDLRPMVADVVRDLLPGQPAAIISARFHNTLAHATAVVVGEILRERGKFPVVLTGGCFQNARLAESVERRLANNAAVYLHQRVPPGDGGIALGQAVIAAAIARHQG